MANQRKKLGQLLLEAELITREQLEHALVEQRAGKGKEKIGQILVKRGIINEDKILRVVCRQLGIQRYNEDEHIPDPTVKPLVPMNFAQEHRLVPIYQKGSVIWVGMLDPTDITTIDAVVSLTELDVEPIICRENDLNELAQTIYGRKFDIIDVDMNLGELEEDVDIGDEEGDDGSYTIDSLQSMAEDAPVVRYVNSILLQALNKRCSDVHFSAEQDRILLKFRIDGELKDFPAPPKRLYLPIVSRLKLLSNLDISVTRIPQDGRFTFSTHGKEVSVRASTLPTIYGEKVVLRLHVQSGSHMTLDQLGMSDGERSKIEKATVKPHGMILATGPTGSGKTTLLYTILDKVKTPRINIVTLEDPVESRISGIVQVQLNSKAGMTFSSGLRSILRQDPDVILIGEIRDQETAHIGIESAMTGHKVLSTLHTNDSAGAVTRFIEMGIEPFLISSTLLVAVAQRLVRRICPDCIEPFEAPASALQAMGVSTSSKMHFFRGKGCPKCDNQGFRGRMGVYEILEVDHMVQELILRRASSYEIKRTAVQAKKLRTLKIDAAYKVFEGLTTFEEYTQVAF